MLLTFLCWVVLSLKGFGCLAYIFPGNILELGLTTSVEMLAHFSCL